MNKLIYSHDISVITHTFNMPLRDVKKGINVILEKYHPDPSKLRYHYYIKKNGNKNNFVISLLIFATETKEKNKVFHPITYFRKKRGDGDYYLIYNNSILNIKIENGMYCKALEQDLTKDLIKVDSNGIVLCSQKNELFVSLNSKLKYSILEKTPGIMRPIRFGKKSNKIQNLVFCLIVLFSGILLEIDYTKTREKYNLYNNNNILYSQKITELQLEQDTLLKIKNQINPNIYGILSSLYIDDLDYTITNFSFDFNGINLTVLGNSNLELLNALNSKGLIKYWITSSSWENNTYKSLFSGGVNE